MPTPPDRAALKTLAAGVGAMMLAMGVGRFAYTPLLPLMQQALPFSDTAAGALASVNYAGYLLGAIVTIFLSPGQGQIGRLRLSLLVNILTTAGMGFTADPWAWTLLRFLSGFSSAGVFVLTSGVVLEALVRRGRLTWSGFLYGGIGAGIALTGLAVPPLGAVWGWRGAWLGLSLLCLPLAAVTWRWLRDEAPSGPPSEGQTQAPGQGKRLLGWLTGAYFLEGLGYIVTGTFLVALVQRMPGLSGHGAGSWILVGLAAVPSCFLWAHLARIVGHPRALLAAHLLQAAGILLPVVLPGLLGVYGGALLFGGTMLGIVTLSLGWGRSLLPGQAGRVIGILTTAFGAGQIIGPTAAGWMAEHFDGFALPLFAAAAVVALGGLLIPLGMALEGRRGRV